MRRLPCRHPEPLDTYPRNTNLAGAGVKRRQFIKLLAAAGAASQLKGLIPEITETAGAAVPPPMPTGFGFYEPFKRALINGEDWDDLTIALVDARGHEIDRAEVTGMTTGVDMWDRWSLNADDVTFYAVEPGFFATTWRLYQGDQPIVQDVLPDGPWPTTGGDLTISWAQDGIFSLETE